jgi:uncharacterized protein
LNRLALISRQIIARLLGLPPALNRVRVERELVIPMRDGETLFADHYQPMETGDWPTVLIRSSWGRGWKRAPFSLLYDFIARRFSERGYHVILQDTHQRHPSEATHPMPHKHEAEDGQDTLEWLVRQPWFNGMLGMWGASYLGYVQWAVLSTDLPPLKALAVVPVTTSTHWATVLHPDGALALDTILRLQHTLAVAQMPFVKMLFQLSKQDIIISKAAEVLPVRATAERIPRAPGFDFDSVRENTNLQSPFWQVIDMRENLGRNPVKAHLIAGWYDLFLREQIEDYERLRAAGKKPYLTIGPWHHTDPQLGMFSLRAALDWFGAQLQGELGRIREDPVHVYVMGTEEWRTFRRWPPASEEHSYYLHSKSALRPFQPLDDLPPDCYCYNPQDPTPSLGGVGIHSKAGRQDNRALEKRNDVLTYTSQPIQEAVEVIGSPRVRLFVRSSVRYTDFFARLCDVWPDGRSINVTDGLLRIKLDDGKPARDGTLEIHVSLWPTAYRFRAGHCLRLQISSGAHPRWSRNLGTGESLSSEKMVSAEQCIYHSRRHPSKLILPIWSQIVQEC